MGPGEDLIWDSCIFHLYFNAIINLNFVVNSILNRRDIMQYLHNVGKIVKIR